MVVVLLFFQGVSSLKPTAPIIATPNTESSPSNFIFSFSLASDLPATGYIMVVFPFYSVTIGPKSCTLLNSGTIIKADQCYNLNVASGTNPNPLTINTTVVNELNPNIQSALTVVVGFSGVLVGGTAYSMQIKLTDNLPSIGALSESFEMYAMSGTGVMLE